MIHEWEEIYNELLEEYQELENKLNDPIFDTKKFIERLKLENLDTDRLARFIEEYLKYHNE